MVVSLGADGAHLHRGRHVEARAATTPDRVVEVTGAGDVLMAGFAFAPAAGEADPLAWGPAATSLAVETEESVPEHLSIETIAARLTL